MYLSIRLDDVELMQSDIEDYLEQDTENFVYHTASYIEGLEYYADELRPLYEILKNFFENE